MSDGEDRTEAEPDEGADVLRFPSHEDHPAAAAPPEPPEGFDDDLDEEFGLDLEMPPTARPPFDETTEQGESPAEPPVEPRVDIEDFTGEHYVQSTTREYKGLAEAIAEAAREEHSQTAVSAAMPGVQTGVVGFEDVTGEEAEDAELIDSIDRARRSDLTLRVGTALTLVAVFVGALAAGPVWITLFLAAIVLVGQGEFYAAVRAVGYTPIALIGLLGAVGVLVGVWHSGPFAAGGFLGATVVTTSLFYAIFPRRYPLSNASVTVFGVAWVAVPMSFAIPLFRAADAFQIVLAIVLITAAADVGAYFFGRSLGRSKMAPVLSPNKTWEGFGGGILGAVAMGAVLGSLTFMEPITVYIGIALGAAVGIVSPVGDLAESVIKRLLGLKDMGSILPGHGGILDRIDAFIVAIPIAYLSYLAAGLL